MSGNITVMRCGEESISIAWVDANGIITAGQVYEIQLQDTLENSPEEWFRALAETLGKIPSKIKKKISLVVPPNSAVFIKHLQIPDVTNKGVSEAFRFECENSLPGKVDDWYFDIYRINRQGKHAFGIAILKVFFDRFVDALLRQGINFSSLCPEALLNGVAARHAMGDAHGAMLIHIDKTSAYLGCLGKEAEYFRVLPAAAAYNLNKTVSNMQKIPQDKADELQVEFLQNPDTENRTFMAYYVKQFAQKLRQEIKKSELFYCRIFEQNPLSKIVLSGARKDLCRYAASEETEVINLFDLLKNNIGQEAELHSDIKNNIGVFVGAYLCSENDKRRVLQLFSSVFSDQLQFQRHNFGYLLVAIVVTLSLLTGLKILKKDIINLETKRASLEAKLLEVDTDIERYSEASRRESKMKNFIKNAKLAFYSQASWLNIFAEMQKRLECLPNSWLESLEWTDSVESERAKAIRVEARMLTMGDKDWRVANENIEKFLASLNEITEIDSVHNVKLAKQSGDIFAFTFDLRIKQQSSVLVR